MAPSVLTLLDFRLGRVGMAKDKVVVKGEKLLKDFEKRRKLGAESMCDLLKDLESDYNGKFRNYLIEVKELDLKRALDKLNDTLAEACNDEKQAAANRKKDMKKKDDSKIKGIDGLGDTKLKGIGGLDDKKK